MDKQVLITVGREFGSGGRRVARALGEKLGVTVYDGELLSKAAEQSGLDPDIFQRSDEKKNILSFGGLFGSNRYGNFTHNVLGDQELFRIQSEVIRDLASKGSCIFVGRASDYILRDFSNCLDVFICAPEAVRAKNISETDGISEEQAIQLLHKKDNGRADWYNFFTFGHWGVASNYDLCIDSSVLGIEGTADFIIDFGVKGGYFGK